MPPTVRPVNANVPRAAVAEADSTVRVPLTAAYVSSPAGQQKIDELLECVHYFPNRVTGNFNLRLSAGEFSHRRRYVHDWHSN